MLRIRLKRVGRKHDPSFRVVVVPKRSGPTSGKYVENLGSYDPRDDSNTIDTERASYWLSVGAQPSDTVHNLFVSEGIIKGDKINPLPKKTPIISEEAEEEEPEPDVGDEEGDVEEEESSEDELDDTDESNDSGEVENEDDETEAGPEDEEEDDDSEDEVEE